DRSPNGRAAGDGVAPDPVGRRVVARAGPQTECPGVAVAGSRHEVAHDRQFLGRRDVRLRITQHVVVETAAAQHVAPLLAELLREPGQQRHARHTARKVPAGHGAERINVSGNINIVSAAAMGGACARPYAAAMTTRTTALIVGAGFGGLAVAIELRRHGVDDFVVLEKAGDVGGVWRENTYPGAGCDVPSPLYSFSFAGGTRWPRRYARQPDILDYLRRTAREEGVLGHIRFGREVASAEFDATTARWPVRTTDGEEFSAAAFVPAVGQLSRPAYPSIPGMETFAGTAFHSAEWDHDCVLEGKRVAVIGTGASAVQFVPEIQPEVARLTVFQ